MFIKDTKQYVDDISNNESIVELYRWHMCEYQGFDETYYELVWLLGDGPPSYSGCQPVGVERVFQT